MRSGSHESEDRQGCALSYFSPAFLCVAGQKGGGGWGDRVHAGLAGCACRSWSRQQLSGVLGGCQGLAVSSPGVVVKACIPGTFIKEDPALQEGGGDHRNRSCPSSTHRDGFGVRGEETPQPRQTNRRHPNTCLA